MDKIRALISDSDGTLLDTVSLIRQGQYETVRQYLTEYGIPSEEMPTFSTFSKALEQTVGGSARDTLEQTVRLLYKGHLDVDKMDFDALHDMLNPVQDRIAKEHIRPYDGLSNFLHNLGETGVRLAIFTSGTPHHVVRNFGIALPELDIEDLHTHRDISDSEKLQILEQQFAEAFGIPGFTIITADATERHKPAPDSLLFAMRKLGVDNSRSAVLGDHRVDMQAGINAGIGRRMGIIHGFDDKETLVAHGATHIAESLPGVEQLLHRI